MDTVYVIIGWLSIPVTLLSVIWMVVTWRRERNLTARSLWIPILVSSLSLFLYVRLIGLEVRPLVTWLPFFGALALGVFLGRSSRVEAHDDRVVASRSPWSFLLWAASFVATQLVALLAPASAEAMLGLLFAATGLTIGEQMALISARSNELGKIRSALAVAAALLLVVALGAALVPRQVNAADVSVDLQDVAELELENGDVYEGMSGVKVDVKGVDGTYSGPSIDLTITNDTTDTLKVRVPVGSRLYPDDDGVQTMLTAGDEVIEVPPGQTVTSRIQAYCGEASDGAPTSGDNFTVGEVVTDPALLRSLEELARRFNNPDPAETFSPSENQRDAVWRHTDREKYPPLQEDEVGYDLYNPEPDGPSEQESGTSGGAVAATNGATAVLVTKPSRGGKKGNKKGNKAGPDADSDSKVDTEPTDDDSFPGSDEPIEDNKPSTDPETNKQADKPPTSDTQPPDDGTGASKVTVEVGGTKVGVDLATKSGQLENKNFTASYDTPNNVGKFRTKDGSVKIDTKPGEGTGEFKGKNKTTTIKLKHSGDVKTGHYLQTRKGGGKTEVLYRSDSTGRRISYENGPDKVIVKSAAGTSSVRHEHPGGHSSVGRGPGGIQGSYQQQLNERWDNFDAWVGVDHGSSGTRPTLQVQHYFGLRINRRLRIPMVATVRGEGGPGSNLTATVGVQIGRRRRR